jgi:hypothetical protein
MAQGQIKKSTARPPAKAKRQSKKGARVTKPQKPKSKTSKELRKFTSGMVAKTEAMLGQKAGHLELIGKGKKVAKEDKVGKKGGSKKFG